MRPRLRQVYEAVEKEYPDDLECLTYLQVLLLWRALPLLLTRHCFSAFAPTWA